jgi:N-acetylmuramoyl-L-alanine amidase
MRLYLALFISIVMVTTIYAKPTPFAVTLYIQGKSISPQPPLITENGISYISINTLKQITPMSIHLNNKDNKYTLTQRKTGTTLIITPSAREVLVNKNTYFFNKAPIFFENSLYIPLDMSLSILGFSISPTDNGYEITPSKRIKAEQTIGTQDNFNTLLASSGSEIRTTIDDYGIPKLLPNKPLYMSFGSTLHDISDAYFYKDDTLYIALNSIFTKENITIQETPSSYILTKATKTIEFSKKSPTMTVSIPNSKTEIQIENTPIKKDNQLYFPLRPLLGALDLVSFWDKEKRIIKVLIKLKQINIVQTHDNRPEIQVITSYPIERPTIQFDDVSKSYTIQLPDTKSVLPKNLQNPTDFIHSIKTITTKTNTTYMEFKPDATADYPNLTLTEYGYRINFHKSTTELIQTPLKLIIKSKGSVKKYSISKYKAENRLIIDIQDTICKLPQLIRSESPQLYSQIRTSQFTESPLQTRIVIDLEKNVELSTHKLEGSDIEITFKAPTLREQKLTAKPKPSPIRSKIIIIDAGHGGRDPGAMPTRDFFEKDLTLDIAKRVEKKLTKHGAFVIMTRSEDTNTNLSTRTEMANQNKADIFVSIHFNAMYRPKVEGTETYFYKSKDKALADSLHESITKSLEIKDNGVKKSQLYVLNHSEMPATLLEPLYLSNEDNFKKIQKDPFKELLANAIVEGISNYFKEH